MRVTETHIYFWGSYLSNFARAPFYAEVNGKKYKFGNSEQYYMARKALEFNDEGTFKQIMDAYDAREAKALGRTVKNFDEAAWDAVSYERMYEAVFAKFSQNALMKHDLLDTGDKTIVEASPYDKIWGVGLAEDDDKILDEVNWTGENRLGKVLMDVRNTLRELEE